MVGQFYILFLNGKLTDLAVVNAIYAILLGKDARDILLAL